VPSSPSSPSSAAAADFPDATVSVSVVASSCALVHCKTTSK
jgi:hypothetical protein